jgi:hypothetical protein
MLLPAGETRAAVHFGQLTFRRGGLLHRLEHLLLKPHRLFSRLGGALLL